MTQTDPAAGYAVRVDWPRPGQDADDLDVRHEFSQFTPSLRRALRRADSTRRYWSRGPLRPLAVTVARIDRAAFAAHDQECASRCCPTTAPLLGMDAADAGPLTAPT